MSVRGSPCLFSAVIDHIMARRIADIYDGSTVVDSNYHHVDFYFQCLLLTLNTYKRVVGDRTRNNTKTVH